MSVLPFKVTKRPLLQEIKKDEAENGHSPKKRFENGTLQSTPMNDDGDNDSLCLNDEDLREIDAKVASLRKESVSEDEMEFSEEELRAIDAKCSVAYQPINDGKDRLSSLPKGLLQRILSNLPMLDLVLVCNRVCKRLKEEIDDDKFLVWKKVLHKYRYAEQVEGAELEADIVLHDAKIIKCEEIIAGIFKYVHTKFGKTVFNEPAMRSTLAAHPLYESAVKWWNLWIFPELLQTPSVWAVLGIMVFMAQDALNMWEIVRLLTGSKVLFVDTEDVLESLHCFAFFFLAGHRKFKITSRYFYHMLSVIHFYESESNIPLSQEGEVPLTSEQRRIINHELQPTDTVKIIAFAGTGKTTTLVEYVRRWSQKRFLVLMFNRKAVDEACLRFPDNAVCYTTHKLAQMWPCYQHSEGECLPLENVLNSKGQLALNAKRAPKFYTGKIQNWLGRVQGFQDYFLPRNIIETLKSFLASAATELSMVHVPFYDYARLKKPRLEPFEKEAIFNNSVRYWAKMCDMDDDTGITYDGYLKLFQILYRPPEETGREPHPTEEYDAILVDEAQDLNPTTFAILNRLPGPKLYVGDPNQQIYAFRGAIDALLAIKSTQTFFLSQSFRFGPDIGFLANSWLECTKALSGKTLIGTRKPVDFSRALDVGQASPESPKEPICIICRSNSTIFQYASKLSRSGKKVYIIGGTQAFNFDDILMIYALQLSKPERSAKRVDFNENRGLMKYKSFENLEKYARDTSDSDLLNSIGLVKATGGRIVGDVYVIREHMAYSEKEADFILTTTHKAKGLEFDHVVLAGDFVAPGEIELKRMSGKMGSQAENEYNLVYVALSRAKKSLTINRSLFKMMTESLNDPFESLITFREAKAMLGKTDIPCSQCSQLIQRKDFEMLLYRPKMYCSWADVADEGRILTMGPNFICPTCSTGEEGLKLELFLPPSPAPSRDYHSHGMRPGLPITDWSRLAFKVMLMEKEEKSGHNSGEKDSESEGDAQLVPWY